MNDNAIKPIIKEIVYSEVKQHFLETSNQTDESKFDYFKIRQRKEKVIHSANATIVILDDGSKGVSKCMPDDKYNASKGIKIAYLRARIKSLEKQLKSLVK